MGDHQRSKDTKMKIIMSLIFPVLLILAICGCGTCKPNKSESYAWEISLEPSTKDREYIFIAKFHSETELKKDTIVDKGMEEEKSTTNSPPMCVKIDQPEKFCMTYKGESVFECNVLLEQKGENIIASYSLLIRQNNSIHKNTGKIMLENNSNNKDVSNPSSPDR